MFSGMQDETKLEQINIDKNWEIPLPDTLVNIVFSYVALSREEMSVLAKNVNQFFRIFKNELVSPLLKHVAYGEQDQAEAMLKGNPNLLLMKSNVTDYSGRKFKNITAFQYTLWALDRHMWQMFIENRFISTEDAARQMQEFVSAGGVKYNQTLSIEEKVEDITKCEMHYNFDELINSLNEFVAAYEERESGGKTQAELNETWLKVGRAQCNVPAHVANEYCHPTRSFDPTPEFDDVKLVRSLKFNNLMLDTQEYWYPISKLGIDFAIFRSTWRNSCVAVNIANKVVPQIDARTIAALCHVRTLEFEQLKQELLMSDQVMKASVLPIPKN